MVILNKELADENRQLKERIAKLKAVLSGTNQQIEIIIDYFERTGDGISAGMWQETFNDNQQALDDAEGYPDPPDYPVPGTHSS